MALKKFPKITVPVRKGPGTSMQLPLFKPVTTWKVPTELPDLRAMGVKRLSIDVETRDPSIAAGLGPGVRRGGYVCGLALGVQGGPRYYFPIRHEGGGNMTQDVMGWARDQLNSYEGEVVGANILYDLDYLAEEGVDFRNVPMENWHDVLLAEPMLDEHKRGRYNLDAVAEDHLGEKKREDELKRFAAAYGWKTQQQIKANIWRLSGPEAGEYGEGDADLPLRVLDKQIEALKADEQLHVYDFERSLIPCLLAMRRRGVRIDMNAVDRADVTLKREIAKWTARLLKLAGTADHGSAEKLAPKLRDRGLHHDYTAKGHPKIDKEFLEKNQGDDLVDAIAMCRRVFTLKNTFVDGTFRAHVVKSRIHPLFNQAKGDETGTVGARFSGSDPNLQFIPTRESEWDDQLDFGDAGTVTKLIRGCVLPDEGEVYQADDESQIEYRLLAHFAVGQGAEAARQAYRDDPKTDFHKLCATMLGVDPEDKVKRKRVKNTNFAKGYGAQYKKLATTFNCSEEEAKAFVEEYDEKIPFSKATLERAAQWAQKRGFVVTVLGRKQRFPFYVPAFNGRGKPAFRLEKAREVYGRFVDDRWVPDRLVRDKDYVALNRKLQSSAGELIKLAMRDAWKMGLCDKSVLGALLLTVHDELGASVPRTKIGDEAGRELTRVMENVVKLKVPIIVNSERGRNWGDMCGENDSKADPAERAYLWDFGKAA